MPEPQPPTPTDTPTADELRKALKAFKKRLKLTRLDDEATLGHGATSSGRSSGVVAVMPPNQFRKAIWEELAKQGRLKYAGQGLYQLPSP